MQCPKCGAKSEENFIGVYRESRYREKGNKKEQPDEWACMSCEIVWRIEEVAYF